MKRGGVKSEPECDFKFSVWVTAERQGKAGKAEKGRNEEKKEEREGNWGKGKVEVEVM